MRPRFSCVFVAAICLGGLTARAQTDSAAISVDDGSQVRPIARLVDGRWVSEAKCGASKPNRSPSASERLRVTGEMQASPVRAIVPGSQEWIRLAPTIIELFERREREQRFVRSGIRCATGRGLDLHRREGRSPDVLLRSVAAGGERLCRFGSRYRSARHCTDRRCRFSARRVRPPDGARHEERTPLGAGWVTRGSEPRLISRLSASWPRRAIHLGDEGPVRHQRRGSRYTTCLPVGPAPSSPRVPLAVRRRARVLGFEARGGCNMPKVPDQGDVQRRMVFAD